MDGKATINSYGLYLVETTGLEPFGIYDVCLAGLILHTNGDLEDFTQNLNNNADADNLGNLKTAGPLDWLAGKTIIQLSFQISMDIGGECDSPGSGPIVQESGLTGIQ